MGILTVLATRVIFALISVVILDVIFLALVRRQLIPSTPVIASLFLMGLIGLGFGGLWISLGDRGGGTVALPLMLHLAIVSFYLTGSLVYMEIRSLLSRGYSLRILQDLLERGGQANLEVLKSSYGEGRGVLGLITKRIETLANFRMLRHQGKKVGPLTHLGKVMGRVGFLWRKTLRLDQVG